jgi:hypothetical protein
LDISPEFIAAISSHHNPYVVCCYTVASTVELVLSHWRKLESITLAPFRIPSLIKHRYLEDTTSIRCFMPIVDHHGEQETELRAHKYADLIKDDAPTQKIYTAMLSEDGKLLDRNDVDFWRKSLAAWIQFWHIIVSFTDPIHAAIQAAFLRLQEVVKGHTYGKESKATQEVLLFAAHYFSRQVANALKLGPAHGSAGVLAELASIPETAPNTALGIYLLRATAMRHEHLLSNNFGVAATTAADTSPSSSAKPGKRVKGNKKQAADPANAAATPAIAVQQPAAAQPAPVTPAVPGRKFGCCMYFASTVGCKKTNGTCSFLHTLPSTVEDCNFLRARILSKSFERSQAFIDVCVGLGLN